MAKITNSKVYGLERAIVTSRYPFVANVEEFLDNLTGEEYARAERNIINLANCEGASGHDQVLTGITVTFDMSFSVQAWQEAERYRFLNFVSSTSKMHKLTSMDMTSSCNKYVDKEIIEIAKKYVEQYMIASDIYKQKRMSKQELDEYFYKAIYNVPSGFEYTAGMITNYRCLRTIYRQRRGHRLPDWQVFCDWIETLPMADKLIIAGLKTK